MQKLIKGEKVSKILAVECTEVSDELFHGHGFGVLYPKKVTSENCATFWKDGKLFVGMNDAHCWDDEAIGFIEDVQKLINKLKDEGIIIKFAEGSPEKVEIIEDVYCWLPE